MNTKKTTWRFWLSLVILLVLVPLTVLVFSRFDRKYYLAGLAIIVLTMAAFFLHFESRKPQARELVILAVLCALAVASRAAFAAVPHFKPMLAIVMLTGIAFGPEAGFLCGAISGFASNFIFGQGPWTPWQMFAFGVIGYLAGKLFGKKESSEKTAVCFYGFFSVLLIYGGIMNPASLMMYSADISPASLAAIYLSGLPMDILHAGTTALFLWLGYEPIRKKLIRVKWKYGVFI